VSETVHIVIMEYPPQFEGDIYFQEEIKINDYF